MSDVVNRDNQKIEEMKSKINKSDSSEAKTSVPKVPESTQVKNYIGVISPQPFEAVEEVTYLRSGELSQVINTLLSETFTDFKETKIYYNPAIGGLGCTARFKFMTQQEIDKIDDDKVIAVSTPAGDVHESNEWIEQIKKINEQNKNGNKYAILTKKGKEYLSDIATKCKNGTIDWNLISNSNCERIPDYTGRVSNIITLDVSLDLQALLYKVYNGTEGDCKEFKYNKKFIYIPSFCTNINGIEFLIKITKIDSKKQKELSDTLGYSRILPSAWNTPTTM